MDNDKKEEQWYNYLNVVFTGILGMYIVGSAIISLLNLEVLI